MAASLAAISNVPSLTEVLAWIEQESWIMGGLLIDGCPCAGINRHEVENERVLQERNSEPS
jgi:hypothetical protein